MLLLAIFLVGCSTTEKKADEKEPELEIETPNTETPEDATEENTEESTENSKEETAEEKEVLPDSQVFEDYLNLLRPLFADMGELAYYYEEVRMASADGLITDWDFADILVHEIIPAWVDLSNELEAMRPDREFRETHEKLNRMVSVNIQGMLEIVAAVEEESTSKITTANQLLTEARQLEREVLYDLEDFAEAYGVSLY